MAFHGYGKQADVEQKSSRGPKGEAPRGFLYSEQLGKDSRNYLPTVFLPKDTKDREFIILDDIKSDNDSQFAALVHQFWYGNKGDNIVTSLEGIDERGCPYAHALRERPMGGGDFRPRLAAAVWLLTVIEVDPFTYERGPNQGKTVGSKRKILVIPRGRMANSKVSRVEEFMNYATKIKGGLRLAPFLVSRPSGSPAKIGATWWPSERQSVEELRARFAKDAEFYGFKSVDDYLKPIDYKTVCKPRTYEEAKRLAPFIEADRRANPSKFNRLDEDETADETGTAPATQGDAYEGPDKAADEGATLPF